jgi:hypothetical protein
VAAAVAAEEEAMAAPEAKAQKGISACKKLAQVQPSHTHRRRWRRTGRRWRRRRRARRRR